MVKLTGFRDSSIGFRLQQACEKALKSWIHSKGGLAPFTHDLVALMDWLEEAGTDVRTFEQIADLSYFAVQARYDDTVEINSPDWPLLLGITPLIHHLAPHNPPPAAESDASAHETPSAPPPHLNSTPRFSIKDSAQPLIGEGVGGVV